MLNSEQLKVVNAKEKSIFLLAGAGTGKTTVIINRLNKILKETDNKTFLLITFTKKGVEDLKRRIKVKSETILITTFHGLCYQFLKEDKIKLVKEEELISEGYSKEVLSKIDLFKRNKIINNDLTKYNNFLRLINKVDFNDLELLLLKKLNEDNKFKLKLSKMFDYIFIDEFQDTSSNQYEILKHLKNENNYFFAVGDPDQSIYNFRGASEAVIFKYLEDFKARKYEILINYRSYLKIIEVANKLIKHNKRKLHKSLISETTQKGNVEIRNFKNSSSEISFIINEIKVLVKLGFKFNEIAIIYRNNYLINNIKKSFYSHYINDINLLTIHQSKGLEFEVVFVIGLNEGILPMKNSKIDEERRLFYVALTRAKSRLYIITNSKHKKSRFIKEIK